MKPTPLPNWLVFGNSLIIVGISAALAGLAIGLISLTWNVPVVLCGLLLLPAPLLVGSLQYAAGFRQNLVAAAVVGRIHCFACVVFGIFGQYEIVVLINRGWSFVDGNGFRYLAIGVSFLYCGFCGWLDLRVENYLRAAAKTDDLPTAAGGARWFQFTLRELLGWMLILSIVASVASYKIHDAGKNFGEYLSREAIPGNLFQLPEGAIGVCYFQSDSGHLAYEFTIDEAGFIVWAEKLIENSPSSPATSVNKIQPGSPFTINRYMSLRRIAPFSDSFGDERAVITQGYFHEPSKGDEGFKLGYDSTTRRAYYSGSAD